MTEDKMSDELYTRLITEAMFPVLDDFKIPLPEKDNKYQAILYDITQSDHDVANVKDYINTCNDLSKTSIVELLSIKDDSELFNVNSVLEYIHINENITKSWVFSASYNTFKNFPLFDDDSHTNCDATNYAIIKFRKLMTLYKNIDDIEELKIDGCNKFYNDIRLYFDLFRNTYAIDKLLNILTLSCAIEEYFTWAYPNDTHEQTKVNITRMSNLDGNFTYIDQFIITLKQIMKFYVCKQIEVNFKYALEYNHPDALFYEFFIKGDKQNLRKAIYQGSIYAYEYLLAKNFELFNNALIKAFRQPESNRKSGYNIINTEYWEHRDIKKSLRLEGLSCNSDAFIYKRYPGFFIYLETDNLYNVLLEQTVDSFKTLKDKYDKLLIKHNEVLIANTQLINTQDKNADVIANEKYYKLTDELLEKIRVAQKLADEAENVNSYDNLLKKIKSLEDLLNEKNETIKKLTNAVCKLSGIE